MCVVITINDDELSEQDSFSKHTDIRVLEGQIFSNPHNTFAEVDFSTTFWLQLKLLTPD